MVNLHCHSEFSLRDGLIRIPELVDKAKSIGQTAIALTEHGHVASSFDFYMACVENNIKPIVGCEAYHVWDISVKEKGERKQHLTLLAKNAEGYKNLMALLSIAATDGFYYTPRVDFNLLEKYREGVIAMSACSFKSALYLYDESDEWAARICRKFKTVYGDDFYLEIMPHQIDFQREHNNRVLQLSEAQNIPLVVTQDSHYLEPSDRKYHDTLMQMQERQPYGVDTLFFPSQEDSLGMFSEHKYLLQNKVFDAIDVTDKIADSVEDYGIKLGEFNYPKFEVTDEMIRSLR